MPCIPPLPITDVGVVDLKKLTKLRRLRLDHTRITDVRKKSLAQALPYTKIYW
ncbi:MAG TPA: hypothetical protein VG826_32805 [Pirellulales bacterium]|nr:hypothetical protein [Pirellulales bacterium]